MDEMLARRHDGQRAEDRLHRVEAPQKRRVAGARDEGKYENDRQGDPFECVGERGAAGHAGEQEEHEHRGAVDQEVRDRDERPRRNPRHQVRHHRRQMMVFVQDEHPAVQDEAVDEIVEQRAGHLRCDEQHDHRQRAGRGRARSARDAEQAGEPVQQPVEVRHKARQRKLHGEVERRHPQDEQRQPERLPSRAAPFDVRRPAVGHEERALDDDQERDEQPDVAQCRVSAATSMWPSSRQ